MSGPWTKFLLLSAMLLYESVPWHAFGQTRIDAVEAQRYVQYCAGCHGADGRGGDKAVSLAISQSVADRTDAELFQIVHDGTANGMPSFAQIGDANIRSLVHYLRVLEGEPGPAGAPAQSKPEGNAQNGSVLYFGKAQCSTCHLADGVGGFIADDLTRYGRNRTVDAIVQAIVEPDKPLIPSSRVVTVTTIDGETLTGVLRNEDNFSLDVQTEDGRYHLLTRSKATRVQYAEHSLMPRDYGSRLTPKELNDIASFLIEAAKRPRSNPEPAQ